MPVEPDQKVILRKAAEQEKEYYWFDAAKSYKQALDINSEDGLFAAETWEKMGFCYNQASKQAKNPDDFREIRQSAVEAYWNAAELFGKENSLKSKGKSAQCKAIAEYVRSWLASGPSEKRKILEKCCKFGRDSLKAYEDAGDALNYGKMCNDLLLCLLERLYVASDWKEMREIAQEGSSCGKKAVDTLSKPGDKKELLQAYSTASLQSWYAEEVSEQEDQRKELMQRSLSYSQQALKLSKEVDDPYQTATANWAAALSTILFTEKAESAFEYAREMLQQGTIVRDNYLKGIASYLLGFVTNWMMVREGDLDKKKEKNEAILKYTEDAIRYLEPVSENYFIAQCYYFYAESCSSLAHYAQTDFEEKTDMLRKAIEIGRVGLEHATRSGSPDAIGSTLHALSKALHFYANLEKGSAEQTSLLEEALSHRKRYNEIVGRYFPSNDWLGGVGKNYEGIIKTELAKTETDKDKKRGLLESAASDMEEGLLRCKKFTSSRPVPTLIAAVATFEDNFGGIQNELYQSTGNSKILSKAIEAFGEAAEDFRKANLPSRAAESYWKMARTQDHTGERQQAAGNFEKASAEYKVAAQRIPHFGSFYLDYSAYMDAWSEIEKAKLAHEREEYSTATKNYENVTNLLSPSKLWGYLSSNFLAWSILEQAEDLSRSENNTEAKKAFEKAAQLFERARADFEKEMSKIKSPDEKEKAVELCTASMKRKDYCLARMNVEEARIFDLRGDYAKSAEKYDSAASIFEKVLETMETGADQNEMKPIVYMCRAWQKMKMADARIAPELYNEASKLFLKAKEYSIKDKTNLLALGNSAFCEALDYGTKFEATKEKDDFFKTKQYLESAANYYLRAGFEKASLWTSATEILFDAYNYMISAEIEDDLERKTKIYLLAEKCLKRSAEHYEAARYVGKRDEVLRILRKVAEKREFALSLGEMLTAPSEASSTNMISAPSMTTEEPIGFSKFERAFIQANLIAHKKEVVLGEDWDFVVQVANLGKNTALLTRIEEIIPKEFDLVEEPEDYRVENSSLNMKGKRLEPLRTEEFRFVLRALDKGAFEIKPKITYVDETGHQMLCELEPVTISVSEITLPGHITTGCRDLDNLLLGGIPESNSVILTSPSCDERDLLIRRFLETGARRDQLTFYVTADARGIKTLVEECQSSFCLIICNPRADEIIENLPNVFKLSGVENLTEINIALTSAFRRLNVSHAGPKRACIEIISDVLLQNHAASTRRWLASIIPELRSRGFTTLAVLNPYMHPAQDVQALLDLFEGEISIYERETRKGFEKFLRIKKLHNQRYLESELSLKKERLRF